VSKNILIIEDDKFSHYYYSRIFSKAGYNSIIKENIKEILEILSTQKVDLIIMDINLKNTYLDGAKIDGLKLSRKIKQMEVSKNIPVMLVTASNLENHGQEFLDESLAEDLLIKPILDYKVLLSKVGRYLN
jgi:CheY-like chemotaxis protein